MTDPTAKTAHQSAGTERPHSRRVGRICAAIGFYAVCAVITVIAIFPFYWSLITSLRPTGSLGEISLLPGAMTLEHYKVVFQNPQTPVLRMLLNSLTVTFAGLFTNLFFGSLAAYSFAKIRFRGHKTLFNIMLISMMVPGVITLIPTFLVMLRFPLAGGNNLMGQGGIGFYDSLAAVVLPGAIGVYAIFFMRQFFLTLSDDMAESARIDGAGEFRIFWVIYLPLVLPGLTTLGIFTFQGGWNNFMWPNIVLISESNKLITMAFSAYQSPLTGVKYGPLMALSMLMALPVLILFAFAQKYFIKGVAIGASKG